MDFNINDKVRARLTPHGRMMHAINHVHAVNHVVICAGFPTPALLADLAYTQPLEDLDGWSEWQMWKLMQEFGGHVGIGMPQCFELDTIRIVTPTVGQN